MKEDLFRKREPSNGLYTFMALFLDATAKILKFVVINDVSKKGGSFKGHCSCMALLFDTTGKNSKFVV